MIRVERWPLVHLAILAPSQRFVVHQDMHVYRMDYVEKEMPYKWALAQTSPGLGEVVSNIAVCQSSTGRTVH